MCSHEIKMKDAGGQKVSAQPFPRAIGSHSLSPSLLVVDTTPIVSFANTTKKYPYLFEIINSINDTTESRVILQFCLTTATTNNKIQSHICAFVRYFIRANFQMCSEMALLNRNMMMMMTLAPSRAGPDH